MKITKIHLKNWHQFQDLELDFTYPEGHEKAGEPLKKVCFIGPNGVGKTKLLNLIANFGKKDSDNINNIKCDEIKVSYVLGESETDFLKKYTPFTKNEVFDVWITSNEYLGKIHTSKTKETNDPAEIFNSGKALINEFYEPRTLNLNLVNKKIDLTKLKSKIIFADQLADFKGEVKSLGTTVDVEIPDYVIQTSKLKLDTKLGKLDYGMIVDRKIANIRIQEALEDSKTGEFDKLKEVFNEVTDGLVSLDRVSSKSVGNFKSTDLVFKTKNSEEVNRFDLSSGIEQIFYRLLFVASFNLKESIILVDEPEISLFPDKQKKIVGWYTDYCDLGNSNQFFFATHSPLVAGQFEACEIFPLDFDKNGKVFVDQDKRDHLLTANYSADEMLYYWFNTNSKLSSPEYYEEKKQLEDLTQKYINKTINEVEEKELKKLVESPLLSKLI